MSHPNSKKLDDLLNLKCQSQQLLFAFVVRQNETAHIGTA